MRIRAAVAAALAAAFLAACGGGGGGVSAPSGAAASAGKAVTDTMTITVPRPSSSSSGRARAPQYISPATQSAEVDVVYGTIVTVGATVDFVAGNGACVVTSTGVQCTLGVLVQPGATTFIVKLFDQFGEQGNVLATSSVAVPPSPNGTPVDVPVTLNGVVGQIALSLAGGGFTAGVAGTRGLVVTAEDSDGNAIAGTLNNPISLVSTNAAMTLSTASVTTSGTPVTVTYNGAGSAAVTINATSVDGGTKTLTVLPGASGLTVSPTSLTFSFVGQSQNVTVSDPNYTGNYLLTGCSGVATASGPTNGTLTVTATSSGSCTFTLNDQIGGQATIAVGVSSLVVPIQ